MRMWSRLSACLLLAAGIGVHAVSESSESSPPRRAVVKARDYGVLPEPERDAGPALRSLLSTVIAAGAPAEIQLEAGRYRIGDGPSYGSALAIDKAANVTLRGVGAATELILTNPRQGGIFIANSQDVWIEDLVIDHDPLPYTQGHVMLINPEAGWFDFIVQPGYPTLDETWFAEAPKPYGQWGMIFDADAPCLKEGATDFIFMDRWERLGRRVWRMHPVQDQRDRLGDMHLGDRFVHLARHGKGAAVFFWRSKDCGARRVAVYASQSLAFGSVSADRVVLEEVAVCARPDTDRLLSANADGVHCQQNIRGPLIRKSRFERMADDGVNIYYPPNRVRAIISDAVFRASRGGVIEAGDTVQVFDPKQGRVLVEGIAKEVRLTPDDEYRIALDRSLGAVDGDGTGLTVYNLSRCGSDYEIADNVFRNHRRHAMMLKASHGRIEGNVIEGVGGLGMVIGNDPEWPEGVIPYDLLIKRNSIKDVGRSRWYGEAANGAAIQIMTKALDGRLAAEWRASEMTLDNNIIVNPPGAALYIGAAHDVLVKNLRAYYREGGRIPRDAAAVIIENAAGIILQQPRIESETEHPVACVLIGDSVAPGNAGAIVENLRFSGPAGVKTVVDLRQ